MSSNKLEVIPIKDVPEKGACALEERNRRRLIHAIDGCGNGLLTILAVSIETVLACGLYWNPWIFDSFHLIPVLLSSAALCVIGIATFSKAADHFGIYFKESDPQYCLPEDSSVEEALLETDLRKAVVEYNTLAQEWNNGDTEDCDAEREVHRQLLSTHRTTLCKCIAQFKESVPLKSLTAPEPERKMCIGPGSFGVGPSGIIK